jgi:hypothetical protein
MEKFMRAIILRIILGTVSAGLGLAPAATPSSSPSATPINPATRAKFTAEYLKSPMIFEMNEGQSDPQVKALARGSKYGLFLTSNESVFVVDPAAKDAAVVRVRTIGANPAPQVSGMDRLSSTSNYHVGGDPSKWRSKVANYARVKYDSIYPGVDLIYYGNQQQLEYDYVVAPGADPSSIRLAIEGTRKLRLDSNGDLLLETSRGAIRQHKPVIYQTVNGARREIAGNFTVRGNRVSFQVGDYDHTKDLVIDPSIGFVTYLGGSGTDQALALTITNGSGVTLVAGSTASANFPIVPMTGVQSYPYTSETDGFLAVFNPTGTKIFNSTYIGGTGGVNVVTSVAVDNYEIPAVMYVAGYTTSKDFDVTKNAAQPTYGGGAVDGWVSEISLDLTITSFNPPEYTLTSTIAFATYLGGSGTDEITGIAMDQNTKDLFVTGFTTSTDFPVTKGVVQKSLAGGQDAFVVRYASGIAPETGAGVVVFSTYLGGTGTDIANGIAVYNNTSNGALTAYICGATNSPSLPAAAAAIDKPAVTTPTAASSQPQAGGAFLVALSGHGTSTYFSKIIGASATELTDATAVTTDTDGEIYITGYTNNPSIPVVKPVQTDYKGGGDDAFVAAFGAGGTAAFLSYFGGAGNDRAYGIGVFLTANSDSTTSINLFIAGSTNGQLPIVNATGLQPTYGGGSSDGFVAMFSTSHGSRFSEGYSTYLGGPGADVIYGLSVGTSGNARFTGITDSTTGLATAGAFQTTDGGGYDGFLGEICTTETSCESTL